MRTLMVINFLLNLPSYLLRKYRSKKESYSLTSVDLLVNYIFKNKSRGIFIDVGCNHPVFNNNTYLLYKRGWNGLNIDLDSQSIDLFNYFRTKDLNICSAISSSESEEDYFFYHDKSPINTINKEITKIHNAKPTIKKLNTKTLDQVLKNSKFSNEKIDFLSIDVEGHELEVLKGFNLIKYSPKIISIEFLDNNLTKIDVKNFELANVINSKLYKYLINNKYRLVNWLHSDLIFAHQDFRD